MRFSASDARGRCGSGGNGHPGQQPPKLATRCASGWGWGRGPCCPACRSPSKITCADRAKRGGRTSAFQIKTNLSRGSIRRRSTGSLVTGACLALCAQRTTCSIHDVRQTGSRQQQPDCGRIRPIECDEVCTGLSNQARQSRLPGGIADGLWQRCPWYRDPRPKFCRARDPREQPAIVPLQMRSDHQRRNVTRSRCLSFPGRSSPLLPGKENCVGPRALLLSQGAPGLL